MNIAAVINNIGPSQKAFYMIKEFNKLSQDPKNCCAAFIELMGVCVTRPIFACYNIAFFSAYNGIAIATSMLEADTMLKTSNNAKKYLYVWDLEWLTKTVSYSRACSILRNDQLNLIARSQSHADIIENFCNKNVTGIVDNWNAHQLREIVEK